MLLLLLRTRKTIDSPLAAAAKSNLIFNAVADAVKTGRFLALEAGLQRTEAQLLTLGISEPVNIGAIQAAAAERAALASERAAHGVTNRWLASQLDEGSKFILEREAERIAVSEAVDAFALARDEYLQQLPDKTLDGLVKVWQSAGDKSTCEICKSLEGETVPVRDQFSRGDPPVHGSCRCSYYVDTIR